MIQFQSPGLDYLERDIFGNCITDYYIYESNPDILYKQKDLSRCSRQSSSSFIYKMGAETVLSSSLECKINQMTGDTKCLEINSVQNPMSHQDMMNTRITSNLKRLNKSPKKSSIWNFYEVSKFDSIEMDLTSELNQEQTSLSETSKTLSEICEAKNEASKTSSIPHLLRLLFAQIENGDSKIIEDAWEMAHTKCSSAQKLVEEVLIWCKTDDCLLAKTKIMKKMNVENIEHFMSQSATNANPTPALVNLMFERVVSDPSGENFKNLGTAINRVCITGKCESEEVKMASEYLDGMTQQACQDQSDDLDALIDALSNTGYITPDTLVACLDQNKESLLLFWQILFFLEFLLSIK
jgi:hypothetical protein